MGAKISQSVESPKGVRKFTFKLYKTSATKRQTHSRLGNAFYLIILTAFGLFSMLPLFYSVITSFKPLDELLVFPPRFWVYSPTLANYLELPGLLSGLRVPLSKYIFNRHSLHHFRQTEFI